MAYSDAPMDEAVCCLFVVCAACSERSSTPQPLEDRLADGVSKDRSRVMQKLEADAKEKMRQRGLRSPYPSCRQKRANSDCSTREAKGRC